MNRIIAIGEDKHWLAAVQKAINDRLAIQIIPCDDSLIKCLDCLSDADKNTLLLVDAYSKIDVGEIVTTLSQRGWIYIIVVAADPSAREIYKVLHESGGYDYWVKTYHVPDIQVKIEKCLDEINNRYSARDSEEYRRDAGEE